MIRLWQYFKKSVGIENKSYRSPLHYAAFIGDIRFAREILNQKDVDINALENGVSALMLAIYRGNTEIVHLLLQYGADVNWVGIKHGLKWAEQRGYRDIVVLLRSKGINCDENDQIGEI